MKKTITMLAIVSVSVTFAGCGNSNTGSGVASPGTRTDATLDTATANPENATTPAKADTNKTDTIK